MNIKGNQIKKRFGSKVKEERQKLGHSQEQFAFKVDLDRTYISDIEIGLRNPSLITIDKIANALNLKLSELFSF